MVDLDVKEYQLFYKMKYLLKTANDPQAAEVM